MANVAPPAGVPALAPAPVIDPTTFSELFQTMPDAYNGAYAPFLAIYGVDDAPSNESN